MPKATHETPNIPPARPAGSASRRVGPDWIDYLKDTGNYERYDGMCDCYVCRQIQKDYWPWKERKQNK